MDPDHAFTITYWGTTGSLTAPLRPAEVTDKLVRAIQYLAERGALAEIENGSGDADGVLRVVERHLPFALRSTYGGNTACAEIETSDGLIVLDSGSGFRELGIELNRRWNAADFAGARRGHVLLTHAHMDHTFATPFVDPYYDPRNHFTLWGPQAVLDSLDIILNPSSALSHTYFPPALNLLVAVRGFRPVEAGGEFTIGGTRITTYALCHPGGCLAYRLERAGRVVVFALDHEHPEVPDLGLADFARGAELLCTEGQYLAEEYEGRVGVRGEPPRSRRGWGHSPIEACIATAAAAGVRRLHLSHREPKRTDEDLERIELYARDLMRQALRDAGRAPDACDVRIPYEGLTIEI